MRLKKILIIVFSLVALLGLIFFFLLNNKLPQIDAKTIKEDVKKNFPDITSIENLKVEDLELNKNDGKFLERKFAGDVKAKRIEISGIFKTSEVSTKAKFVMLYSYINDKFKLVAIKDSDIKNREYKPIGPVSSQSILKDLRNMKIGDFKKGYVGSEKNTTLTIEDRKTNLNMGVDSVEVSIKVKNEFAISTIRARLKYNFVKDKWVLKDKEIEDKDEFKVRFILDNLPKEPDEKSIIELLTNPKNQKTYMTNKSFTKKLYVSKPKIRVNDNILNYEYIFVASYPNIGDIEYKVLVPYEFSDGEWIKKDVSISYNKALLTDMESKWGIGFSKDLKSAKEFLCFYRSEDNELEGYYGIDGKKELVKARLVVDLKDNNWTLLVSPIGLEEGKNSIFNIKNLSLNLKDRVIVGDSKKFEPKHKVTQKEIEEFQNNEGEKLKDFTDRKDREKEVEKEKEAENSL